MSKLKTPTKPGTLVTRTEVREILGVSKQAVHHLDDQLPAPVDVVENGRRPIWRRVDIERFAERRTRRAEPTPDA